MTLLKTIPMLLLAAFLFSQCTGKSGKVNMKKPEDVTLAFLRTFSGLEFEKAKSYGTPETQQLIGMMEGMMGAIGEDEIKKMKAESKETMKSFKTAKCKVEGEMAFCTVCCGPDGTESPEPTTLKKIDGKWYVHIDKNAMGGEGGDE